MGLTVEFSQRLGDDLTDEATREGLPVEAHATVLLALTTALMKEDPNPLQKAVRNFIASRTVDSRRLADAFEEIIKFYVKSKRFPRVQSQPTQEEPIDSDLQQIVTNLPPVGTLVQRAGRIARQPSVLGKYAHVSGSSDEFAGAKRAEIEREERGRE